MVSKPQSLRTSSTRTDTMWMKLREAKKPSPCTIVPNHFVIPSEPCFHFFHCVKLSLRVEHLPLPTTRPADFSFTLFHRQRLFSLYNSQSSCSCVQSESFFVGFLRSIRIGIDVSHQIETVCSIYACQIGTTIEHDEVNAPEEEEEREAENREQPGHGTHNAHRRLHPNLLDARCSCVLPCCSHLLRRRINGHCCTHLASDCVQHLHGGILCRSLTATVPALPVDFHTIHARHSLIGKTSARPRQSKAWHPPSAETTQSA